MQKGLICAFIIVVYLSLAGCQTDSEKSDGDDHQMPDQIIIKEPENIPDEVFIAWQQALDLGRFNEALKWSTPATQVWVGVLKDLAASSEPSEKESLTKIESIQCKIIGDTAFCMFAEEREDMLQLDSVRVVRINGTWKVDLPDRIGEQNGAND